VENGDVLLIDGQRYIVRGVDPGGVTPRLVYLEHKPTRDRTFRHFDEIAPHMVMPRLRLIHGDNLPKEVESQAGEPNPG